MGWPKKTWECSQPWVASIMHTLNENIKQTKSKLSIMRSLLLFLTEKVQVDTHGHTTGQRACRGLFFNHLFLRATLCWSLQEDKRSPLRMGGARDQALINSWNMNCTHYLYKVRDAKERQTRSGSKNTRSVEDDIFSKKKSTGLKDNKGQWLSLKGYPELRTRKEEKIVPGKECMWENSRQEPTGNSQGTMRNLEWQ